MDWRFGNYVWSRSAGFPTELLDALRSDETSKALDRVTALEHSLTEAQAELAEMLRTLGQDQPDLRRASRRLRRAVRSSTTPLAAPSFVGSDERARWDVLQLHIVKLRNELREASSDASIMAEREHHAAREQLSKVVTDPRVERGAWMSSRSMAGAFRALTTISKRPTARRRALERRAALFVQRLAAKYPLLSDLGLSAWGRIDRDEPQALRCDPAHELVAMRERFFEHWAIHAVAYAMHSDPSVVDHCPVRLNHGCALELRTLYYPIGHRANLEPSQVKVLGCCDGSLTLGQIRQRLAGDPDRVLLERVLEDYLERGVLTTEIPMPTGLHPEHHLLRFVQDLSDACSTKASWLQRIRALIELRDAMSRATNAVDERAAEGDLDAMFTQLTGLPSTRGRGAMHGGRFLTYEDARRDVELRVGAPFARDLEQLHPVLDLSRWIVLACSDAYEQRYQKVFHKLAAGLDQVDGVRLMRETQWISETTDVEAEIQRQVQRAWVDHLGERATRDPLILEPSDFRAVLGGLPKHEADGPWIPAADVHSVSALPGIDPAGGYQLVVGELYKAVPLLVHPVALAFCPMRDEVVAEMAAWLRSPVLQFADAPATFHRSNLNLPDLPQLFEALLPNAHSGLPPERTARAGELVVTRESGRLWVQTRDGRVKCGLLALRWSMLQKKVIAVTPFPKPEQVRLPRISMGNWVLSRAQWRAPTEGLLRRLGSDHVLAAARAWRAELGLPERIFVHLAGEPKAIYIDLRSHVFADLLVSLARRTEELTVVEMLPMPEHCWMTDARGRRFVSEVRLTALGYRPIL